MIYITMLVATTCVCITAFVIGAVILAVKKEAKKYE